MFFPLFLFFFFWQVYPPTPDRFIQLSVYRFVSLYLFIFFLHISPHVLSNFLSSTQWLIALGTAGKQRWSCHFRRWVSVGRMTSCLISFTCLHGLHLLIWWTLLDTYRIKASFSGYLDTRFINFLLWKPNI